MPNLGHDPLRLALLLDDPGQGNQPLNPIRLRENGVHQGQERLGQILRRLERFGW